MKAKHKPRSNRVASDDRLGDELYYFIDAHNDDDAPDGAWWAILEDSVTFWNKDHGTSYDENDTVHSYLRRKELESAAK